MNLSSLVLYPLADSTFYNDEDDSMAAHALQLEGA